MPGTLSATVSIVAGAETDAAFAGSGALTSVNAPSMAAALALSGAGYLDTAAAFARYAQAAGLSGGGALTAPTPLRIHPMAANLTGAGALSATAASARLDFTDDFSRADAASPGTPWVSNPGGASADFAIVSNMLVSTASADKLGYGPVKNDNGIEVIVTMGFSSADMVAARGSVDVFLRVPTDYLYDGSTEPKIQFGIYSNTVLSPPRPAAVLTIYNGPGFGTQASRVIIPDWSAGSTLTCRAWNNQYVMFLNGYALVAISDDVLQYATPTINNTAYPNVMVHSGILATPLDAVKIDQIRIQELSLPEPAKEVVPLRSGNGTLTATARRLHPMSAALTGGGTLSATARKVAPTIVGSNSVAGSTSVPIPAHVAGDLFILWAFRDGSTGTPTAPGVGGTVPAWETSDEGAHASPCSAVLGLAVATADNHTSGTWPNATGVSIIVLRNAALVADSVVVSSGTGTTITYPARTLWSTAGTSRVIRFAGHRTATNLTTNTPTGYTQQSGVATEVRCLADTVEGVTSNPTADAQTVNASSGWLSVTLEVLGVSSENINDPFTTAIDTNLWKTWRSGNTAGVFTATINAGRLSLNTTTPGVLDAYHLISKTGRTLGDGQSLSFKVVSGTTAAGHSFIAGLTRPITYYENSIDRLTGVFMTIADTTATAVYSNAAVQGLNVYTNVGSTRTHAANTWYRFRRSGTTVFWEYSTNGSTWNSWTSTTVNPAADLTGVFELATKSGFSNTMTYLIDDAVLS